MSVAPAPSRPTAPVDSQGRPLRMDAYYYGFAPTGVELIDRILSAVACAGKAFHHTEDWTEEGIRPYEDVFTGDTCVDWIQNAANEAAQAWNRRPNFTESVGVREALLSSRYHEWAKTALDLLQQELEQREASGLGEYVEGVRKVVDAGREIMAEAEAAAR